MCIRDRQDGGEMGMIGDVPMEPEINGGIADADGKAAEI